MELGKFRTSIHINANQLKIFGALTMFIDHMGLMFFPDMQFFRIIGRLSFPIFAYMISEGCSHTSNKPRYFLRIFSLAFFCQVVYYIAERSLYMSILVTFSISILLIFLLQYVCSLSGFRKVLGFVGFGLALAVVLTITGVMEIDYGFWGILVPVFASISDNRNKKLFFFTVGLFLLSMSSGGIQRICLLSVILLYFYDGERGKANLKYFFYIFYPLHLALLEVIYLILNRTH